MFPYSEFWDNTIQGIDAQVECIPREGFGDWEAQIVQRDVAVAINGAVRAQAEDVFERLKGSRYTEISEQRLFIIEGSWESEKGYFLGSGMNTFMVVGIDLAVENLLGLF